MSHQAGSRVRVTIDGRNYSARTAPNIRPARISNQEFVNQDGKVSYGTSARAAAADITFDVGGPTQDLFDQAFMQEAHNITILEIDRRLLHQFTACKIIGEPSINVETGEVTGLSISSDSYLRTPT